MLSPLLATLNYYSNIAKSAIIMFNVDLEWEGLYAIQGGHEDFYSLQVPLPEPSPLSTP